MPKDKFGPYGEGMASEPDPEDVGLAYADRAIKAMAAEFKDDKQVPRFVVVVETPPDGEIFMTHLGGRTAIASTGDDAHDTFRMLMMATLSIRRSMSGEAHARALQWWNEALAEFTAKHPDVVAGGHE